MQYFKHMSNMRHDVKIKRLIAKFGLEGYGLYNLILEAITEKLETDSPIPDLQETCEDIALFYNGNTSHINEIANFLINQGLLELDEITGHILCHKVYKFLEASQTRSERLREMIKTYKDSTKYSDPSEMSVTVWDKSEEKKRKEENRKENDSQKDGKSKQDTPLPDTLDTKKACDKWKRHINERGVSDLPPGFEEIWTAYPKKVDKKKAILAYLETRKVAGLDELLHAVKVYAAEQRDNDTKFVKHAKTFLGPSESWRDYLEKDLTESADRVNVISKTIFDEEL